MTVDIVIRVLIVDDCLKPVTSVVPLVHTPCIKEITCLFTLL